MGLRRSKAGVLRRYLKTWSRTFPYLRPHWPLAAYALITTVLGAGIALLGPWPLAFLVDSVLGKDGKLKKPPAFVTNLVGNSSGQLILFAVLFGLAVSLV